jgi:hypothetical protein
VPPTAYGGKAAPPTPLKISNFLGGSADTLYDCSQK